VFAVDANDVSRLCVVHSDLSEYNLLYDRGELVVIDLSHGIGSDNANAATFLRDDVVNVTRFFSRRGARTLSPRAAFEFVIARFDDESTGVDSQRDRALYEAEKTLLSEVATSDDVSDSDASDSGSVQDVDAKPVVIDGADVDVELAKRAARREQHAAPLLDELIANDGHIGAFTKGSLSAADAAFLDRHMPRSLHEVTDVTQFAVADIDTFGLVAPALRQPE